jgi:hypothetical protein
MGPPQSPGPLQDDSCCGGPLFGLRICFSLRCSPRRRPWAEQLLERPAAGCPAGLCHRGRFRSRGGSGKCKAAERIGHPEGERYGPCLLRSIDTKQRGAGPSGDRRTPGGPPDSTRASCCALLCEGYAKPRASASVTWPRPCTCRRTARSSTTRRAEGSRTTTSFPGANATSDDAQVSCNSSGDGCSPSGPLRTWRRPWTPISLPVPGTGPPESTRHASGGYCGQSRHVRASSRSISATWSGVSGSLSSAATFSAT